MRENYLEANKRKKILLLSDDLRFPSGVGTISKELVLGTCHVFNWVQIAAGINHPDQGKVLNMNDAAREETGVPDPEIKLIPSNGYGDPGLLRQVIAAEKPDAVFIFTDPRYWTWLFNMEREIRSRIPIMYLNIWDDLPYPMYNKSYYKSCDGLFGISKQTVNVNKVVLGEEAKDHIIRYIPHGVSSKYKILAKDDPKLQEFIKARFGDNKPDFLLLYNARNLGRKRASDIILAWNDFCRNRLTPEQANRCLLYMHTDVVDNAGTDLGAVVRAFCDPKYCHVVFDSNKYSTEDMNMLYNMSDGVILVSSAEGWGLSVTEALRTGKMFIGTVTGGIQDQMRFADDYGDWIDFSKKFPSNHTGLISRHGNWCIPVYINNRALVGSPQTPYIYDDRAAVEDISEAIYKLWSLTPEEREKFGAEGEKWATSDEAGFTSEKMAERFIEAIKATLEHFQTHPRARYEFIKISSDRPSTRVNYDPVNYTLDVDATNEE